MPASPIEIQPSRVIQRLLIEAEICAEPSKTAQNSWPALIAHLPDDPVECVAIYDTAPVTEGRLLAGGLVQRWGIQVRARAHPNEGYAVGWAKITRINRFLMGVINVATVVDGVTFVAQSIAHDTGPYFIGIDDQTRYNNFTLNVLANIRAV
jgi:hypothetical protein